MPAPVALCPDADVIGAPFYLMRYVPGLVLRTAEDGARLTPVQARQLSEDFTDMLAAIHGVDLAATGLAGFGRPEGYMERQLARWQRQWELSATREMPGYDELTQRLAAGLPGRAGLPPRRGPWCTATTGWTTRWSRWTGRRRGPAGHRGRPGLGDVHPGRPAGRPRAGPRLLDGAGRR